jgi:hypothetical protein
MEQLEAKLKVNLRGGNAVIGNISNPTTGVETKIQRSR